MVWFKVDDGLPTSEPVMRIPRRHRTAAIGLWALAGAWCAKELNDGRVPAFMIEELASTKTIAEQLVQAGLWTPTEDGYAFVRWEPDQPTRAQVLATREAEAERKRRQRERMSRRDTSGTDAGLPPGSHRASEDPVPSRPDPTVNDSTHPSSHVPDRESSPQDDRRGMPAVDLRKVKVALLKHSARSVSDPQAFLVVGHILDRAKTTPKDWTAFVVRSIERDPFEFQKLIDEAGVA